MFSKYFQTELTYLRELGREFSRANPSLAGAFSDREGDPDVQRLLEGFAFLSARIRERTEDALPELIDALGQLVVPQVFRQIPACSIVQFTPNTMAIQGRHRIGAGAELATKSVEGTRCTFRTVAPIDLFPIRLEGCSLDPSTESEPKIRLRFRVESQVNWSEHGKLRLFLNGPLGLASTAFLWLREHLSGVDFESEGQTYPLGDAVTTPGLGKELQLLPWPDTVPDGLCMVQEYLSIPEKLLFFDIDGFNALPETAGAKSFDVILKFNNPPKLPERLTQDLFQIHCVPVVNLFQTDGDPITHDSHKHEHLLRASSNDPLHIEIYSVESVVGLERAGSDRREYSPYFAFTHLSDSREQQRYYSIRRTRSPIDHGIDTYLSLLTPADVPPDLSEEVLSIELSCTNRKLPNELRPGDICEPTSKSPAMASFRNISRVTRPTRPPIGAEKHWRLVSHVALNTRSLADSEVLKSVLAHYNTHEETDLQLFEANRLRISSIRTVTATHERRVFQRIPMFGLHTQIELDESAFASIGDAYLFGCVLQRLMVTESPLNSFHRLTINLYPSNRTFTWKPESGTQALL